MMDCLVDCVLASWWVDGDRNLNLVFANHGIFWKAGGRNMETRPDMAGGRSNCLGGYYSLVPLMALVTMM